MLISLDYKFAFLCIPKCGSTSVERAIAPYCQTVLAGHPSLKHVNAKKYRRFVRPLLRKAAPNQDIETFCIMREPVERVFSWYHYQARRSLGRPSHPSHYRYTGGVTLEEFVEGYLSESKPSYADIGTQAKFVRLTDGTIGVDRIFRLDQMNAVSDYLSAKIGRQIIIPFKNKSPLPKSTPLAPSVSSGKCFSLASIFPRLAGEKPTPLPEPDVKPLRKPQISDALLARLKDYLADDYVIYNSLAGD